jgi:hypothetical protein
MLETFTIQYGVTDNDCKRVSVTCKEEELETIAWALIRYATNYIWHRPIACCAYRANQVASFRTPTDLTFCDCM